MANIFDIEEKEGSLPILCIFGYTTLLHELILRENASKFRIILVAQKRPDILEEFPHIYFVPYHKTELLPKLEETIRYALVLLDEKNAHYIHHLTQKLIADRARSLMIFNIEDAGTLLTTIAQVKHLSHMRIAAIGEVLTRKKTEAKGNLSKIIENAILNGEMRVNGEEDVSVYGVTLDDARIGIGRLLFGSFKNETLYCLFYNHPATILETAHMIARVEPEIRLIFTNTKTESVPPSRKEFHDTIFHRLQMEQTFLDSSFAGFEKGVEQLFKEKVDVEPLRRRKKKHKILTHKVRLANSFKFAFFSLLAGSLLFVFLNFLFLGIGLLFMKGAVDSLQSSDFHRAATNAKTANYFLSSIKPTIELTFDGIGFFDKEGVLQKTYSLVTRGRELTEIAGTTVYSLTNNRLDEKNLSLSLANLSYLFQEGQRITLETSNKTLSEQLKDDYAKLLSFSGVLPQILGFDEEKNYLLLFQNDEELRPTGGFIGSVGELIVKEGRVEKVTIQDVYELDGQLKNHIEPPFIVRRYLQPHLYLRDSNFYLNFQETASTSAKIYNLETGKEPHAVIAIDLKVLKEIMKIAGPITLPSYNVTVTHDTVSQFIQSTIKDNFFPGSTQKKDVLNSLFTQLVEKSKNDPKFNVALLKLLPDLLEQKDILISFRDNSIQKIFSANGYAGEFIDSRPAVPKMVKDFLYINEANIGVNKVNAAVSREVSYTATVGEGALLSKASIQLTNNSPSDNYTVYITAVVPRGSILKTISFNGVNQPIVPAIIDAIVYEADDFVKPEGLEVEQYERDQHSYISFIAIAEKGEKTRIDIDYENGAAKPLPSIVEYSLFYIKQPGTAPYQVLTSLNYPETYTPVDTSAQSYGKNFMETQHIVNKDFIYRVELQRGK